MSSNVSLEALKAHLFETLEGVKNLSDNRADDFEKCSLEQAKTIVNIADSIIDIYKTQVDAVSLFSKMDDVASLGTLAVGLGITDKEQVNMIEG